jgi:hypothetical protein
MVKKIESNNNIVYVAIVAIVAIVGLIVLLGNSNNQTSGYVDMFDNGNVAGQAFGGSYICMFLFQHCIQTGNSIEFCMTDYERCETVRDWIENYDEEIQSR